MATKSVLLEAIRKLEINNMLLREKLGTAKPSEKENIVKNIAKNDSMILDFKFRLNENET